MNEAYSEKAKMRSKLNHEQRKLDKLLARRAAAVKAGDHETALKYSNKIHNYSTEGGMRNPKIAEESMFLDIMKKAFKKTKKVAKKAKQVVSGDPGTPEEQLKRAKKMDKSPWGAFRDRG